MRLVIVDQSFGAIGGHHAEYTMCIAREAAALARVTVLANIRCETASSSGVEIRPVFHLPWTARQHARTPAGFDPTVSFPAWSFLADLRAGLSGLQLTPDDHVFIHSIGFTEIEDLLALQLTTERAYLPVFDILLRRDLDEIGADPAASQRFKAYLRAFAGLGLWPDHARFFADTDELSGQYSQSSGITFRTVAIPFDQQAMQSALRLRARRRTDAPVVIGYLGDARPEKGYQFLPGVAAKLDRLGWLPRRTQLRLQSNYNLPGGETPAMPDARRALESFGAPAVELIYEPLDQNEYYRQMAEMDIVVLPYLAERYRHRSSGIFVQAAAAGKTVVVPNGTTMSAAAMRYGIDNCITYDDPAQLPEAVVHAVERHDRHTAIDVWRQAQWRAANSPAALVEAILGRPPRAAAAPSPLVLHVIDGHSSHFRTGTAANQAAQLRFLRAAGYRVATVFLVRTCPGEADAAAWIERNYRYWFESGSAFSWLVYFRQPPDEHEPRSLEKEVRDSELLSVPETLRGLIASGEMDLVWTNYVTTVPFLRALGVLEHVPVLCEAHDIQSSQFAIHAGRPVDQGELRLELSLLGQCQMVNSVNAGESSVIADALGAARVTTVVPPLLEPPLSFDDLAGVSDLAELVSAAGSSLPFVDLAEARRTGETWQADRLRRAATLDLIFVSSVHTPNIRSLDWFLDRVYGPHLAPSGVTLLLAGSLSDTDWARERQRRFPETLFLAGRVKNLRPLYAAARVVVLPITEGAGVNIKTVEALAFGKPVVATALALRGLAQADGGLGGFGDPLAFAERVVELLTDVSLRREEARRNWELAAPQRDLAVYFETLSGVFGRLLGRRPTAQSDPSTEAWEFVEWDDELRLLNRLGRVLTHDLPHLSEAARDAEMILHRPQTRERFARILDRLCGENGTERDARLAALGAVYSQAAYLTLLGRAVCNNVDTSDPRTALLRGSGSVQLDLAEPIAGFGWYPAEQGGRGVHRWTGPEPRFTLELFPPELTYRCRIELTPIRRTNFNGFSITRNGAPIPYHYREDGDTIVVEFPVSGRDIDDASLAIFTFRHDSVFAPAEHGSSDQRSLGFAVRSIDFTPLERRPSFDRTQPFPDKRAAD